MRIAATRRQSAFGGWASILGPSRQRRNIPWLHGKMCWSFAG